MALQAVGCGGSSRTHVAQLGSRSSTTSDGPPPASASPNGPLAFSRCIRAHGVANYPDPNSSGVLAKKTPQQLGVSGSQFRTAQSACTQLLPNGGEPTAAALQQSWNNFRSFARCMRRHGVPSWPDPSRYPEHPERPTFDLQAAGIDPSSPQISAGIHDCAPLLQGTNPQRLGEGGS
jgi:hypothetical protein